MNTKVNSFDTSRIMLEISKAAPLALLVFAFLSFFAVGVFAIDYYQTLFEPRFGRMAKVMAILIAVIQESVRFGLLITSIRDFADKKKFNGWLGLLGSTGLVIHDISLCNNIAKMWSATDPLPYSSLFMFLILIFMKTLSLTLALTLSLLFTACGSEPMTDADMATKYGLSLEEYQEQKEAAARMNMSIEDHLNMGGNNSSMEDMDHSNMDHGLDEMSESEVKSHEQAAADMGMTLEEHEAAGHVGH